MQLENTTATNTIESAPLDQDAQKDNNHSVLYRWQGIDKFVPVHYLATKPSTDWETFHMNGETFIIYSNAKDTVSQVLKAKLK